MINKKADKKNKIILLAMAAAMLFSSCGAPAVVPLDSPSNSALSASPKPSVSAPSSSSSSATASPAVCLECVASGEKTDGNEYVTIDYSNGSDGYIMVNYLGSSKKVKLQLTGPDSVTYTYNISNGYIAFPLSAGKGNYSVNVCENIVDSKYSVVFGTTLSIKDINEFSPYLYPNQYVAFDKTMKTVKKGSELASGCATKLDVVTKVYDYITGHITYDYKKADTVQSGYIPVVDEILDSGTGICLDYAAVMATMLRTQSIPTRLEVGYTGADMVYHAWISVYIEDVGWLNGIIQFNGKEWSLVDPTFGASMADKKLKNYIGDGTNYSIKYVY